MNAGQAARKSSFCQPGKLEKLTGANCGFSAAAASGLTAGSAGFDGVGLTGGVAGNTGAGGNGVLVQAASESATTVNETSRLLRVNNIRNRYVGINH